MADIPYTVIRSSRRTVAIAILPGGEVVIRCPKNTTDRYIRALVESRRAWILKQLARQPAVQPLTDAQLETVRENAKQVFAQKVAQFAPLVGVDYGKITVRFQSTRWGSCSAKGNLNFNGLLMLAPPEVLDYVVIHELCHRKEMNHSKKFWALVGSILPEYPSRRKWLKDNGAALLARMPK